MCFYVFLCGYAFPSGLSLYQKYCFANAHLMTTQPSVSRRVAPTLFRQGSAEVLGDTLLMH